MVFVPVPNCAQIELCYTLDNQIIEQVFHYSGLNVSDDATLTGLATNALESWRSTFKVYQTTGLTLFQIKATSLESQNAPGIVLSVTSNNTGNEVTTKLPNNVAICISFLTQYRGRSYRGRTYFPGVCQAEVTGNTVTQTVQNDLAACYSYWDFLDVSGEPYAQVITSRFHNGAPRVSGITENVLSWRVNATVASQRRRLPGRGQ